LESFFLQGGFHVREFFSRHILEQNQFGARVFSLDVQSLDIVVAELYLISLKEPSLDPISCDRESKHNLTSILSAFLRLLRKHTHLQSLLFFLFLPLKVLFMLLIFLLLNFSFFSLLHFCLFCQFLSIFNLSLFILLSLLFSQPSLFFN
jgi:hypothetical protein